MIKKVAITCHRGIDIEFDIDSEQFACIITDGIEKASGSFTVVKKFIDEYKKNNQTFKPFYIELSPFSFSVSRHKTLKVIGLRKDRRFITETDDGVKGQLSDFDGREYILTKQINDAPRKELQEKKDATLKLYNKNKYEETKIKEKFVIVTLTEFKETLEA